MLKKYDFVVHLHLAKRAGKHWDIRFQIPDKPHLWASFASRKEPPLKTGIKTMVIRTHDHTKKEALFTGEIKEGYGTGKLSVWDEGKCQIEKFTNKHIVIIFEGRKLKGKYHFLSTSMILKNREKRSYLFFKAKETK